MALLKNLKNNFTSLQNLFKKKKRSSSTTPTTSQAIAEECVRSSSVSPARTSQREAPAGSHVQDATTQLSNPSGRLSSCVDQTRLPQAAMRLARTDTRSLADRGRLQNDSNPLSSVDSDSEQTSAASYSRCRCSGKAMCKYMLTDDLLGEKNSKDPPASHRHCTTYPSTSQRRRARDCECKQACISGQGRSSCSQEELLVEEMLNRLKTRGTLNTRRSRSRSRRSRTRQNGDTSPGIGGGIVINNVRVVQTYPLRETDSDDSNTSLADLPMSYQGHSHHHTPSCSNQSDSSFHSATAARGSDAAPSSQDSSSNQKLVVEEDEEGDVRKEETREVSAENTERDATQEEREEWISGVNSTEHNRTSTESQVAAMTEELSSYGPEEFVLDLLFAMCRGTWSDIL